MDLTFDFSYLCNVQTKSAHSSRNIAIIDTKTVQIREVSSSEAPVAVEWVGKGKVHQTRWYDGCHYFEVDTDQSADELLDEMKNGIFERADFNTGFFRSLNGGERFTRIDDKKVVEYDEKMRKYCLDQVVEWASRCLVIDGRAFFRCAEPHYIIGIAGIDVSINEITDEQYQGAMERPHTDTKVYNAQRHRCFGYYQFDVAMNAIKMKGDAQMGEPMTVYIPQSMSFDYDKAVIYEAAEKFLSTFGRLHLGSVHPKVVEAIASMVSAIWKKDITNFDADELVTALEAGLEFSNQFMPEVEARNLIDVRNALDRWYDQTISPEVGMGPGLR